MMQLLIIAVVLAGQLVDSHVLLHPITAIQYTGNGGLVPSNTYWINHGAAAAAAPSPKYGAVSRETLEDQSAEGVQQELLPDISEEQAHIDPDDEQVPSHPSFPLLPQLPPRPNLPPGRRPSLQPLPGARPTSGDPGIVFDGPRSDGSYDFSYSQPDQSRSEKGDAQGNVQGTYTYTGLDGKVVTVTYTAGAGSGYVPVGEGLVPPPQPSGDGSDDGGEVLPSDDSLTPVGDPQNQLPVVPNYNGNRYPNPSGPNLPPRPSLQPGARPASGDPGIVFNGPRSDGSYDFSYSQPDQSRSEKGDSQGNVEGTYTYTGLDGKDVTVTYTAGAGTGYVPVGEGLLPPPQPSGDGSDDGGEGLPSDGSLAPVGDPQNQLPVVPNYNGNQYPNPSGPNLPPRLPQLPPRPNLPPARRPSLQPGARPASGDPGITFNGPRSDGSYDFSYSQPDQSRSEKGDAQGNVQGTYTYTGLDGKDVTVTYTAGAGTGYVPVGEGLLPPPQPSGDGSDDGGEGGQNHLPSDDSQHHLTPVDDPQNQRPVVPHDGGHQQPNNPGGEEESQGVMPYSYNYDAHASSKSETADDNGNVKGSYWYIDGAGANRTVSYTVNGDEGFVAKEDVSASSNVAGFDQNPNRPGVPGTPGRGRKGGDIPIHTPKPIPPSKGRPAVNGVKGGAKGGSGWGKYPLGK